MLGDAWRRNADEAIVRELALLLDEGWPARPGAQDSAPGAATAGADRFAGIARGDVVGAYWPMRGEPDIVPCLLRLHARGVRVALPAVPREPGPLSFGRWTPGTTMRRAAFGTREPEPFEPLDPDFLLVPCVGFDASCHRLGYGGGYYDRTLAAFRGLAIGVAYEFARLSSFEAAAHDRPLAAIVTERGLLRRGPDPGRQPGR